MTEPEVPIEAGEVAKRGRPRPEVTKDRDEKVYTMVAEAGDAGLTRKQIDERLTAETGEAKPGGYLSLYRLRIANRVHKAAGNAHSWVAGEAVVPEPVAI